MQPINDIMTLVSDRLGDFGSSNVVVGEPMTLESRTIVTLSSVGIGFGGAGGEGEGDVPAQGKKRGGGKGKGVGGGTGGGGKVRPVAVLVFGPDGIQVLPIPGKKNAIERLVDRIPELVDHFTEGGTKSA